MFKRVVQDFLSILILERVGWIITWIVNTQFKLFIGIASNLSCDFVNMNETLGETRQDISIGR